MEVDREICDRFRAALTVRFVDGALQYCLLVMLLFIYQFEGIRPISFHPFLTEVLWSVMFAVLWGFQHQVFKKEFVRRAEKLRLPDDWDEGERKFAFGSMVSYGIPGQFVAFLQAVSVIALTQIYLLVFDPLLTEELGDFLWLFVLAALWLTQYHYIRKWYEQNMFHEFLISVAAFERYRATGYSGSGFMYAMRQAALQARKEKEARESEDDAAASIPDDGEALPIPEDVLHEALGIKDKVDRKVQ